MSKRIVHLVEQETGTATCGKEIGKKTGYTSCTQDATCPDCLNIHYTRKLMNRTKRIEEELVAERAAHLRTLQALDKKPAVVHLVKDYYNQTRNMSVPFCEIPALQGSVLTEDIEHVTCPHCLRQVWKQQKEKSDRLSAAQVAYDACAKDQAKKIEALRSTVKHMKRAVELAAGAAAEMCREGE